MSLKNPSGFVTGLVAEIAVVAAVVAILPKVPLGRASPAPHGETASQIADQRPSLVPRPEPLLPPIDNWRTAVSRPEVPVELSPANPAYVEQRLDKAGQQLVNGVAVYLSQQAEALLQPPPYPPIARPDVMEPRSSVSSNSFRY